MFPKLARRLILILVLFVPFLLRERGAYLEPYPAIVLPRGASLLDISEGVINYPFTELVAVDSAGVEHVLEPKAFFAPIPAHYWTRICRDNFGLEPQPFSPIEKKISLGLWSIKLKHDRETTPEQRQETIAWLKDRAAAQGVTDAKLILVRFSRVTMRVADQEEIDEELVRVIEVSKD